ncbi:MAG: zinc ribbon domain-containing protein [Actinobacteria bacterium]|nr:zinc ribbon domain-containing protein [Actinomycetota bacterium]
MQVVIDLLRESTLLSRLAVCGPCGSPLWGRNPTGPDDRTASYYCSNRSAGGDRCVSISVLRVHGMVVRLLLDRIGESDLAASSRRVTGRKADAAQPDPDRARVDQLRAQVDRLESDRLAGMYDDADGTAGTSPPTVGSPTNSTSCCRPAHGGRRGGHVPSWPRSSTRSVTSPRCSMTTDSGPVSGPFCRRRWSARRPSRHRRRFDPRRVCIVGRDGACWVHLGEGCP